MKNISGCDEVLVEFTQEEEAYRRGFCHGVSVARRTDITEREALNWRHSDKRTGAPRTPYENTEFEGMTKNNE